MTPEQEKLFEDYGCVARCLIAVYVTRGAKLTKEEFVARYAPQYWPSGKELGALRPQEAADIAEDLGLARSAYFTDKFDQVRKAIREESPVFILAWTLKKREEDGTYSDYKHCTLIRFETPSDDGLIYLHNLDYNTGCGAPQFVPDAAMIPLEPLFLVFEP